MTPVQDCPTCKGTGVVRGPSGEQIKCRKCSNGKIVTAQNK